MCVHVYDACACVYRYILCLRGNNCYMQILNLYCVCICLGPYNTSIIIINVFVYIKCNTWNQFDYHIMKCLSFVA